MLDPLDIIIDEYLRFERRDRSMQAGYPSRASGTSEAGSNRSWESADELLDASVDAIRMSAMSGAMLSMTRRQDQAIRIDASNRRAGAAFMVIPNLTAAETAREVHSAKTLLRSLLLRRNVVL